MPKPRAYYHYTCEHRARGIEQSGVLRLNRHPLLGARLVWLTDLAMPDRWALGLTSNWITCDRTLIRVSVQSTATIVSWRGWALVHKVPRALIDVLEENTRPERWWVSEAPLRIGDISQTAPRRAPRCAS
ncbi:hypothetical protein [Amycolatopsis sp. NPDC003861]